jgi:precorrin-4 methylase
LVRSAVAKAQLDAEVKTTTVVDPLIVTTTTTTTKTPPTKHQPTFFHATTSMDGHRSLMKIGKIDENVLAHLASIPGAEVKITYTLEVTVPTGIPDNTLRTVNENAKSLKVDTHGFE